MNHLEHLDAFTRTHLQDVLLDIWEQKKTTMIFVTHDIDESIYLADRVVIMSARPGQISKPSFQLICRHPTEKG